MSFKVLAQTQIDQFKTWRDDAEMQARLAKSEAGANLRTAWHEAEQYAAKLEAKVEQHGADADEAATKLLAQATEKYEKLKTALKD